MEKNMTSELISEYVKSKKIESGVSASLPIKKSSGQYGIKKETYEITTTMQSRKFGLKKGIYTIIHNEHYGLCKTQDIYFTEYLAKTIHKYISAYHNILVIGLGNRHISADSIGPKVLHYILPTRYLKKQKILRTPKELSALSTSVYALTGIDSFDIVQSIVKQIHADCVIAIDSLCATNYKRLGTSFQVHDAGIMPGQGVGNQRKVLNLDTLGIPVITIGVPLVMYASSFNENIEKELVVTLKDIDEVSSKISKLIGLAISKSVTGMTVQEIEQWLE